VAEGLLEPAEPAAAAAPDAGDGPHPLPAQSAGRGRGEGGHAREPHLLAPRSWEAAALAAFAALLAWSHLTRGLLAAVVAGADLVFHEAGHPIFGLLGSRFLMFLGGTIAQLAIPSIAAVAFLRRRRAAPFAAALVWLGFNLVDVGRYAADAEARALPLLAPDLDSHDWWNMLGTLGVREHCEAIGGTIAAGGWLLWAGAPAWAAWRWWRSRAGADPARAP
jgi:hypothetical protein